MANIKKPNIIVFFTDQQRWDSCGVNGNPMDITPNFDRMAMKGTNFKNAFSPQPVCGPARSCLQTGNYATTTGVYKNHIALNDGDSTLAKNFAANGYNTGYIGKWHLGGTKPSYEAPSFVPESKRGGYDYWLGVDLPEFVSDEYHTLLYDNDNNEVKLPGYRVDAYTDAAIRYIDDNKDSPFFLFLSFLEPHMQNTRDDYPAPAGYEEIYRKNAWIPPDLASLNGSAHQHIAGYYGIIKRLDEALGRILDALTSLDLTDNTIVLLTSDHGCHFKTRNSEYKRSCHESSIRIPLAAQGPGFNGGGTVEELVSLIDIAPSLYEAANIKSETAPQGRSMIPLVKNDDIDWPDDVLIQISESQVGRAVRTHRWKYSVNAFDKDGRENATSDEYTEEFLYDLKADSYELNNLVGLESHKEVADMMKKRLVKRIVESGEREPVIYSAQNRTERGRKWIYPKDLTE